MPEKVSVDVIAHVRERQYRNFPFEIEERAEGDGHIVGYAAVFNELSEEIFGFRETIRQGAFKKTIRESDVRALFNHDPNFVLGRKKSGTLKLKEDDTGLRIDIAPPQTQIVRDLVIEPMRRGDIDQMSFGFRVVKDQMNDQDTKNPVRELLEVKLFDISPVTFPAYPQTSVSVRGLEDEVLFNIQSRVKSGEDLDDWDILYINRAIEILRGYLPEGEPDQAVHSPEDAEEPDQAVHSIGVLRDKLALVEKIL